MSIIAACLPTLGGFLKSRFSQSPMSSHPTQHSNITERIGQRLNRKIQARRSSKASSEAKTPWVPLQVYSPKAIASNEFNDRGDLHKHKSHGIMVDTTFDLEHVVV